MKYLNSSISPWNPFPIVNGLALETSPVPGIRAKPALIPFKYKLMVSLNSVAVN